MYEYNFMFSDQCRHFVSIDNKKVRETKVQLDDRNCADACTSQKDTEMSVEKKESFEPMYNMKNWCIESVSALLTSTDLIVN